jgi:hypothetical protein
MAFKRLYMQTYCVNLRQKLGAHNCVMCVILIINVPIVSLADTQNSLQSVNSNSRRFTVASSRVLYTSSRVKCVCVYVGKTRYPPRTLQPFCFK